MDRVRRPPPLKPRLKFRKPKRLLASASKGGDVELFDDLLKRKKKPSVDGQHPVTLGKGDDSVEGNRLRCEVCGVERVGTALRHEFPNIHNDYECPELLREENRRKRGRPRKYLTKEAAQ